MRTTRRRMYLIVAALMLVACGVALWGHMRVASPAREDSAEDEVERAVSKVEDAPVSQSSATLFLSDLERDGDASHGVIWEESADVPETASTVLKNYRSLGTCELACSGYLDIKGNAWGAVIRGGSLWVDVVYITVPDGGETSTVRIVRLLPEDGG